MATVTKLEFAVQMTCQSCVEAIRSVLDAEKDIQNVSVDLANEQVLLETTLNSYTVQQLLETTGRRAVLMGLGAGAGGGHVGAGVVMLSGGESTQGESIQGIQGIQGITRLVQVSHDVCIIDGTVDGLIPGLYSLCIHTLGDISDGCNSCGDVLELSPIENGKRYGDLCDFEADQNGRAEYRVETERVKIWDIIGRSLVIHELTSGQDNRIACGIVARSAGLFQNPKRICACDGIPVWDERDIPIAGGARQGAAQSQL